MATVVLCNYGGWLRQLLPKKGKRWMRNFIILLEQNSFVQDQTVSCMLFVIKNPLLLHSLYYFGDPPSDSHTE